MTFGDFMRALLAGVLRRNVWQVAANQGPGVFRAGPGLRLL